VKKDSGVEWIGEIPSDWSLVRFKDKYANVKEIAKERSVEFERLALTLNGVIKRPKDDSEGLQPKEFDGYQILRENDFIFKMIDLQNVSTSRVGLSPYTGLVSPAYIRFSPKKENQYNQFVYYYLMSLYYNCVYNNLGGNGVRSALNAGDMGEFLMPYPEELEQRTICAFLDGKRSQIDTLIANVQAQIEKLKAYKQSVITEVVTKGLDPTVPMKDSGVEWFKEINAKYSIQTVRSLFRIKKDIIGHEPKTVLSITQRGLRVKNINENEGQMANSYANYQIVCVGDFAMNHMDLLTGGIGIADIEGVTSPDYRVFVKKHSKTCSKYFLYVFETYYRNKIFYAFGQGAANMGRWRLPAQNFNTILIPVPSVKEQHEIVEYLDEKCGQVDRLIALKEAKIEKLEQYKKSLIYEYVTGKKEV
jgi:type I restriction enzyme S subunit